MPTDFYTFRQDLRPFGMGTPVGYRYDPSAFPDVNSLGELVQGEMLAWDSTNNRVIRFVRTASGGKFIGISRESAASIHKLGNQAALNLRELSVFTTGVHELMGQGGQTYLHGDAVYMAGTDAQSITKTAGGGTQVGTVHNPQNRSIAGAVRVPVLIDEFTKTQD